MQTREADAVARRCKPLKQWSVKNGTDFSVGGGANWSFPSNYFLRGHAAERERVFHDGGAERAERRAFGDVLCDVLAVVGGRRRVRLQLQETRARSAISPKKWEGMKQSWEDHEHQDQAGSFRSEIWSGNLEKNPRLLKVKPGSGLLKWSKIKRSR